MEYNQMLNQLIEQCKEQVDKGKYQEYETILNKLELALKDYNKINDISDEELKLIEAEKYITILKGIKILIANNSSIDETEITNFIKNCIQKVNYSFENDEEANKYREENKRLDKIAEVISNGYSENEELILSFINECYKKDMISVEDSINLVFYVTSQKVNKINSNISNTAEKLEEKQETVINENEESISPELTKLFNNYGYDYEKLNSETRKNLEKYGKVEYSTVIIEFLKKHNISEEDLITHQGIISKLMAFQDKTALEKIDKFIEENNCTLSRLLSFGSIFFHRNKKYKFRNKNGEIVEPQKNDFCAPCGNFESFSECVELYKKIKKLPADYKMTDEDFVKDNKVGMVTFFTTPIEKIRKNLALLEKYHYINENELPNALVALTGRNTEYLMDRLIESGLQQYGKRYSSILKENDFPFRWYKIRMARDLKNPLFDRGGLKSELKSDNKPYMGINWHTEGKYQVIEQEELSMGDLVQGGRTLPYINRERLLPNYSRYVREELLPDELAKKEFQHFYRYHIYDPIDIYKYSRSGVESIEEGLLISTIFKLDYSDEIIDGNAEEDSIVKLLDTAYKEDDVTYNFKKEGSSEWPDVSILVSRPKVIRLINLLKRNGAWMDENTPYANQENLLLSVLVKDTVLSTNDIKIMRVMVQDLIDYQRRRVH